MAKTTKSVRHLRLRGGRYFARLAVPEKLQKIVGKCELLEPLGPDRSDAIVRLHGAVARFHRVLADASKGLPPPAPPISIPHAVHDHYRSEQRIDDLARYSSDPSMHPQKHNALFASAYLHALRKVAGGFLTEDEIKDGFVEATMGWGVDQSAIDKERPATGSKAWLDLAKALASAQVEAIERSRERDQGDFKGKPDFALLQVPPPKPELEIAPISIEGLLDRYLAVLARSGRGVEAGKRWRPVFKSLTAHLGHDDARKITKADLHAWVEHLRATLAEKTIRDVYLGSVKAVLTHAFDHDILPGNPTAGVKIKLHKPNSDREKGYTPSEGAAILRVSLAYQPKPSANPQTRERDSLVGAKRWAPLLCAFSGSRIAEITQLRKQDIRETDGITFMRITPEAGSVKTGQFRDVPLHRQIVDAGFLQFVEASSEGPLFYEDRPGRAGTTHPSKTVSGRVSQWLRTLGIVPANLQPNHAWRHAFKTVGIEAGVDARVLDAIQGHAPKTAGEAYGSVTLKAKALAIARFPRFSE